MRHGCLKLGCLLAALTCLFGPAPDAVASASVPGELLVRFEPAVGGTQRAEIRRSAGTSAKESLPLAGLQLVSVVDGSVSAAEARLEQSHGVLYAEPNVYRSIDVIPNDPYFNRLWGLHNTGQTVAGRTGTADADIDAPEAWDVTTGSGSVAVAVVDTGIDAAHPDLAASSWGNLGESGAGRETNGIDDDRNGFVDDVHGWDFVDRDAAPDDANGHGTHVAGTIAARGGDGVGVAGVSWQSRLMSLRVLDASGSGTLANVITAYGYAAREGATIVNGSLGGPHFSRSEYDTIRNAPGVLFVVAAGNDGVDDDMVPEYPCSYDLPNVVCVAASDQRDALAGFSSYGARSVDLAAPGTNILSDQPGGGYAYYSGTSMATPHVAGAAALVYAHSPAIAVPDAKAALLSTVDVLPGMAGETLTGGRLNVAAALGAPVAPPPAAPAPPPAPAAPAAPVAPAPAAGGKTSSPGAVPKVALKARHVQDLRRVLRRGVRVRVRCSTRCTLRSRLVRRGHSAGHRSTMLHSGQTRRLSIALNRKARRALRARGRARITVVARATSGATIGALARTVVIVRR